MAETKWSSDQQKLVFSTVAKGLNSSDQVLFEAVCISSGLDPLRKEIYAVSRGGRMSIQTGIDGYLKLANSTRELDGMEVLFYDKDGNESEVWLKSTPPTACLVRVYRKGAQHPFTASCRFDAYKQNSQIWAKFPETMLAKATTTLALRRGFADVIAGIASADEMDQAGLAAPEALEQGTPESTPVPKTSTKRPASNSAKAKASELSQELAAQAGAQALAAATKGIVIETGQGEPSCNDLRAVASERGLTESATEGILSLINGDFAKGIQTIKDKNSDQIEQLNSRFKPIPAGLEKW